MSDVKVGAGVGPGGGGGVVPLPEKPIVGTSNVAVGVTGESRGSVGVSGISSNPTRAPLFDGVLGVGLNGVHGQSASVGGSGVFGEHSGSGAGVSGSSVGGPGVSGTSQQGHGVHGKNGGGSRLVPGYGAGVWGESDFGYGVYGASKTNPGVQGVSAGFEGVHGESQSATHAGVSGINDNGGIGVYGASSGWAGYFAGKMHADGDVDAGGNMHAGGANITGDVSVTGALFITPTDITGRPSVTVTGDVSMNRAFTTGDASIGGNMTVNGTLTVQKDVVLLAGQDCAEQFELNEARQLEPGTVVIIDRDGTLRESHAAYDKKVAGVVSGAGAYRPGIVLGKRASETRSATVALVGRVYCKVDAHYSSIGVGDLLTTSATPGHAMRADDPRRAFGAVIGKALERLEAGRGLIPILVALQ